MQAENLSKSGTQISKTLKWIEWIVLSKNDQKLMRSQGHRSSLALSRSIPCLVQNKAATNGAEGAAAVDAVKSVETRIRMILSIAL